MSLEREPLGGLRSDLSLDLEELRGLLDLPRLDGSSSSDEEDDGESSLDLEPLGGLLDRSRDLDLSLGERGGVGC